MNFPYLPNALKLFFMEKAREFQKISFCFTDYTKAFDSVNHNSGKFLKSWEYQTKLPASRETCTQVKKQQLEPYIEQWIDSKLGKEYDKAVYCHPAYLTSMQDTHAKCQTRWIRSWNQDYWKK